MRRSLLLGIGVPLLLAVAFGAYAVPRWLTATVLDDADPVVECSGWTGVTDGCAAWGRAVLEAGAPSTTFELEDVVRIRFDRGELGLAERCTVEYFLGRYPDEVAWNEELDCRLP